MIALLLVLAIATVSMFAQEDVLTRRNDNFRSGLNLHETSLTPASVRTRFGKLWTLYADAKIMAHPMDVSNLVVPIASMSGSAAKVKCSSACNAVIFATMKGTLYA